jgi:hypothetical protein
LSLAELIAFVIRSAYDKLPHAFRLEEFFFETDDADVGVGGIPRRSRKGVRRCLINNSETGRIVKCFHAKETTKKSQ